MSNPHESDRAVFADPIAWYWQPYINKNAPGWWWGKHGGNEYQINLPRAFTEDVDAPVFESQWCIVPAFKDDENYYYFPVPSPEQGKAVCARHGLTGDWREMESLLAAAHVQSEVSGSKIDCEPTCSRGNADLPSQDAINRVVDMTTNTLNENNLIAVLSNSHRRSRLQKVRNREPGDEPPMDNDAQDTLLALANPIVWKGLLSETGEGHWWGRTQEMIYFIIPPLTDLRTLKFGVKPSCRFWRVQIWNPHDHSRLFNNYLDTKTPIDSVNHGKSLCLQHALTGEVAELRARHEAASRIDKAYEEKTSAAFEQLYKPHRRIERTLRKQGSPPLIWRTSYRRPLKFTALSASGSYTARFDCLAKSARCSVTWAPYGGIVEKYDFLNFLLAEMACLVHSRTGQWLGMS